MEFNIDAGGFDLSHLTDEEREKLKSIGASSVSDVSNFQQPTSVAINEGLGVVDTSTPSPSGSGLGSSSISSTDKAILTELASAVSVEKIKELTGQTEKESLVDKVKKGLSAKDILEYYTESDEANLLGRAFRYWSYRQSPLLGGAVSLASRMIPKDARDPSLHPAVKFILEKIGGPAFEKELNKPVERERRQMQLEDVASFSQDVYTPSDELTSAVFTNPADSSAVAESFSSSLGYTAYTPDEDPEEVAQGLVNQTALASSAVERLTQSFISMGTAVEGSTESLTDFKDNIVDDLLNRSVSSADTGTLDEFDASLLEEDTPETLASLLANNATAGTIGKHLMGKLLPAAIPVVALLAAQKVAQVVSQGAQTAYRAGTSFMNTDASDASPLRMGVDSIEATQNMMRSVPLVGQFYDASPFGMTHELMKSQLTFLESIDNHAEKIAQESMPFNSELIEISVEKRMRLLDYRIERGRNLSESQIALEGARAEFEFQVLKAQDKFYREAAPFIHFFYSWAADMLRGFNFVQEYVVPPLKSMALDTVNLKWISDIFRLIDQYRGKKEEQSLQEQAIDFLDPTSSMNQGANEFNRARRNP